MTSPSRRNTLQILIVLALGALSLVLLWFFFELRYLWYTDAQTTFVLRGGFAIFALAIVLSWLFAPSRLIVAALGILALFFPLLVGISDLPTNPGFLPFVAGAGGLLVLTTHLRRRIS